MVHFAVMNKRAFVFLSTTKELLHISIRYRHVQLQKEIIIKCDTPTWKAFRLCSVNQFADTAILQFQDFLTAVFTTEIDHRDRENSGRRVSEIRAELCRFC